MTNRATNSDIIRADIAVIGAGFGGLATALGAAERGARVVMCETLNYPGGCASTFVRKGCRFESGATLFSGFGEGQLFRRWIDDHDMDVQVDWLDPVVELRTPDYELAVPRDREAWVNTLASMPGADERAVRAFFAAQKDIADALWGLLERPELLPPFGVRELLQHAGRAAQYAPLVRTIGRSLRDVMRRYGVADFEPLRVFADAVSQITVQASADEAEAPFALSTMDYFFRGTGHVRGGIGQLASAMVSAIERLGGTAQLANRVRSIRRVERVWRLETRRGIVEAPVVVANLLPQAIRGLLPEGYEVPGWFDRTERLVETGWGAAMLYLTAAPPAHAGESAHHLELVADPSRPFIEGNHLFCSISGAHDGARAPDGERTLTVSTHIPLPHLRELGRAEQAEYVARVQDKMREGLASLAPEWWANVQTEMTASPRTFERFTARPFGYVGGIPRRVGLHHYRDVWPSPVDEGLYVVGDSVFPGQSTLAVALGGLKLAEKLAPVHEAAQSRRVKRS